MELHQNAAKFCDVLDQLEGSPLPFYLAKQPVQAVRTLFLEVSKEPPLGLYGDFTLVDGNETLRIKIVDWSQHGSRKWIECIFLPPNPAKTPPEPQPRP